MKILLFSLLILCSSCCHVSAQTGTLPDSSSQVTESDSDQADTTIELEEKELSKPVLRNISADTLKALRSDRDFAYMQYADSFFRNHKMPPLPKQEAEEEHTPGFFDNPGLHKLFWGLAIVAVLYLLWRMFIGNSSLFARNKRTAVETSHEPVDDTSNQSIETLIEKAIRAKDYRMAIRYLYLQTLVMLGEKEFISLAPQKTNYQYIKELNGKHFLPSFSKLTLQYEYVWYGDFKLNNTQFDDLHEGFKKFEREL